MCVYVVDYLDRNGLYSVLHSAYWQLHSMEAALFWVQNDILQAAESQGGAIQGPVLLQRSDAVARIPTNGSTAFNESYTPIG